MTRQDLEIALRLEEQGFSRLEALYIVEHERDSFTFARARLGVALDALWTTILRAVGVRR